MDDKNNTMKSKKFWREFFVEPLEPSCCCHRDVSRITSGSGLPLPLWAFQNRGEVGAVRVLSQLDLVLQLAGRLSGRRLSR